MGRAPCSEEKEGLKKGAWTAEEDEKLVSFIRRNKGHGSWRTLPTLAGLERCGKSCRLRWTNYLRPNIKRGNFSAEEERIIIQLHAFMGNKWSSIASHLPGRTDNEVKNHWNTHLKKRLTKMGIDPTTHLPLQFIMPHNQDAANYYGMLSNHYRPSFHNFDDWRTALLRRSLQVDPAAMACQLAQWELASRLGAEARMQIAASSAHADHMQNYASWLQLSLQQSQAPGDNLMQALNLQLQATALRTSASDSCLANTSVPLIQPSQSRAEAKFDEQFLKQVMDAWDNQENQGLVSSNLLNGRTCSTGVPHAISEAPVYTSTCSMATPETCSSESTSQLFGDQLAQLPDLLSISSNEEMNTMPALNVPDLTSPPAPSLDHLHADDINNVLHDSYWNKMLDLLGPPAPSSTLQVDV